MSRYDFKLEHDIEYVHFLTDPNIDATFYFKCIKERHNYSRYLIRSYLDDDGWNEDVQQLFSGTVTHLTNKYNVTERPHEDDIDEEGCDSEGTYWGEFDYRCDYKLTPVELLRAEVLDDPSDSTTDDSETT